MATPRFKKVVYTGRMNRVSRLGHTFERGVPKEVPFLAAMKLLTHYAREYEVIWEGRLEDSLSTTTQPTTEAVPDKDVAVEPVVAEVVEAPKPSPARGRPKKPAAVV